MIWLDSGRPCNAPPAVCWMLGPDLLLRPRGFLCDPGLGLSLHADPSWGLVKKKPWLGLVGSASQAVALLGGQLASFGRTY